jgi:O-antigen ligase
MRRFPLRRTTLAALLFLLLLLPSLAAAVWADNALRRGIAEAAAELPPPAVAGPALGVNLFNVHLEPDPDAVDRTFSLLQELGAGYARMQVPWDDIEIHGRGDFEDRRNTATIGVVSSWAKYDRIVAAAERNGVQLIMRLDRPPAWARPIGNAEPDYQAGLAIDGNTMGPPDEYADYGAFAAAVAERYRGRVRYFQIWNEPNLRNEWGWRNPDPAEFTALLQVGYRAIKQANPDAQVLFPGLAPTDGLDVRAPQSELEYLDAVYRAGGAAFFDIMAAQNYGLGQPPEEHRYVFLRQRDNWSWNRPIDTRNDVSRIVLLREVMERHGDTATQIWITEFGYNAAPETLPAERRFVWGPPVSEERKGEMLVAQLARARQEWPWLGVANVWMLRYGGYAEPHPDDPTPYFALVTRDWQKLPAFGALQAFAAAPTAGVGSWGWTHPAVTRIENGWQLRFSGTRLVLADADYSSGFQLDGRDVTPEWQTEGGRVAAVFSGLSDQTHTLTYFNSRAPAGFSVERPQAWAWWPTALLALLIGGQLILGALLTVRAVPFAAGLSARLSELPQQRQDLLLSCLATAVLLVTYRASDQLPWTAVGIGLITLLAWARPDLLLPLTAAAIPLYFMPKTVWDSRFGLRDSGITLPLHELLLLPAAAATLVRDRRALAAFAADWRANLLRIRTLLPVLLLAAAGIWGTVIAVERGPALRELRWIIIEPLLFAALVWWHERQGRRVLPAILGWWLAAHLLAAVSGILQVGGINLVPWIGDKPWYSNDSVATEGVTRASGLYGHPNSLGLALGRVWPLAAALSLLAWQAGRRTAAAAAAGLSAVLLLGLTASFSRGALLGAAAAMLTGWFMLRPPSRRIRLGLLIGGPLAAAAAMTVAGLLGIERLSLTAGSSGLRLQTWAAALQMLRDHPLGVGLDQFLVYYPQYMPAAFAGTSEAYTAHPHNLLLDLALRLGPLGLIAFGWLLFTLYRRVHDTGVPPAWRTAIAAVVVAALVHGMVDAFFFWPDLAFGWWLLWLWGRPAEWFSRDPQLTPAR